MFFKISQGKNTIFNANVREVIQKNSVTTLYIYIHLSIYLHWLIPVTFHFPGNKKYLLLVFLINLIKASLLLLLPLLFSLLLLSLCYY